MSRGFELASGAAAWTHRSGEKLGDLVGDSVYGPYNNALGEFNFFALSLQVSKKLDELARNRAHPVDFRIHMGAQALGLTRYDYAAIADEKGEVRIKGARARFTLEQVSTYVRQAYLLYDVGGADIDYGRDSVGHQWWRVWASALKDQAFMEHNKSLPSFSVVPYLGSLAFTAMEFTAKTEAENSPFKRAFYNFEEGMKLMSEAGVLVHPGIASDKIGRRLRFVSNDLVALDPDVVQSSHPFEMLDISDSRHTGRAALQIVAASYLKPASRWEPVSASVLTDVAHCAWGMTRLGSGDYSEGVALEKELLTEQWGLGLQADPYWLREDDKYYANMRSELAKQAL